MPDHFRHIFVLMQRIQDSVIYGYVHYQPISCDAPKAKQLKRRFAASYETEISSPARWRRRRAGLACAKFLALEEDDGTVRAFLMVTGNGDGRVRNEALHDASHKRIALGAYELVHDGAGWSWRFTNREMKAWRSRLHAAIARGDTQGLQQIVRYLYRTAGFRLVRGQVGDLANYIRGEWRRLQKGKPPELPRFLPYIRRLPDNWTPSALAPTTGSRDKRGT